MTDDRVDASMRELTNLVQLFKNDNVRIVSVGFGVRPEIKELQTMATKQQNVFLYHGNIKLGEIVRKMLEGEKSYNGLAILVGEERDGMPHGLYQICVPSYPVYFLPYQNCKVMV